MRKLLKYAIVTAALLTVTSPRGIGAIHNVSASLDSTHLLMGNVTTLHIQAVADGDDGQLLLSDDTITSAVEYRSIDFKGATSLDNGTKRLDYDITIQAFDSGPHIIPPIPFMQGLDTAYTDALELNVTVPLNADTINDVTANSIDVLDPPNVEWTDDLPESVAKAMKYWPWILGGVMLIIAAIALWLILKRRKKQAEAEAELPPYNWAMLKLKEIRERNMFNAGQERLYFTTLTEVLRIYLMRRFDINAMEMTSSQILASLPTHIPGVKEGKPLLKGVLRMADFVKFAKHTPSTDDNIRAFNNAVQFVELTRPLVDETANGDGTQETETTQESQSENTTLD